MTASSKEQLDPRKLQMSALKTTQPELTFFSNGIEWDTLITTGLFYKLFPPFPYLLVMACYQKSVTISFGDTETVAEGNAENEHGQNYFCSSCTWPNFSVNLCYDALSYSYILCTVLLNNNSCTVTK